MRWPPARCRPSALALAALMACAAAARAQAPTPEPATPPAPAAPGAPVTPAAEPATWDPAVPAPAAAAPASPAPPPPATPSAAPTAPSTPSTPAAGPGLTIPSPAAAAPASRWRLAPLSWSGSLAYDLRVDQAEDEPRITEQLVTARLGTASYIYQPWLATFGVNLGFTHDRLRSQGDQAGRSNDRFVSGGLQLNVFPRSRFPFSLHAEASDSRLDLANATTLSFRTREYGFDQRYRPLVGRWSLHAGYRHREQTGVDLGEDRQDSATFNYDHTWQDNNFNLNLSDARSRSTASAETSHYQTAVARHGYNPRPEFSLSNSANWSRTDNRFATGTTDLVVSQWSSVALMRPAPAWTLSANARALRLDDQAAGGIGADTLGAGLGANWEANSNLRVSASTNATLTEGLGARTKSLIASLGATWQGDSIELPRDWLYNWFTSGNLNAARSTGRSDRSAALQLGHSAGRNFILGDDHLLNFTLGQTLSLQRSSTDGAEVPGNGDATRLDTHSAAVSWSNSAEGASHYARLGFNDSREIGGSGAHFQLYTGQVSGSWELSRDQVVAADLSGQRIRQKSSNDTSDLASGSSLPGERIANDSLSGEASYRHRRWLGVPRLSLTARVRLARDMQSTPGALSAIPDRETRLAEARADYQIGRLETSFIVRVSQVDDRWRQLLLWRLQRNFSGS